MYDPQRDWSDDSTCPKCGGYALASGNDDSPTMTYSCEGDCGRIVRSWSGYRPRPTRSRLPRPTPRPLPPEDQ